LEEEIERVGNNIEALVFLKEEDFFDF